MEDVPTHRRRTWDRASPGRGGRLSTALPPSRPRHAPLPSPEVVIGASRIGHGQRPPPPVRTYHCGSAQAATTTSDSCVMDAGAVQEGDPGEVDLEHGRTMAVEHVEQPVAQDGWGGHVHLAGHRHPDGCGDGQVVSRCGGVSTVTTERSSIASSGPMTTESRGVRAGAPPGAGEATAPVRGGRSDSTNCARLCRRSHPQTTRTYGRGEPQHGGAAARDAVGTRSFRSLSEGLPAAHSRAACEPPSSQAGNGDVMLRR